MQQYVDAVLAEAGRWSRYLGSGRIETVFFGGGTPTMLPQPLMSRLLAGLRSVLPIAKDAEWTVEANPATVDAGYSRMLLEHGVNRLSVGAQSFVAAELQTLGRAHDAEGVRRTIDQAHQAGFERVSLDLMYGVPGQTAESWAYSLAEAMRLGIRHISCYCLTLEEGTPMWEATRMGKLPQTPEEQQLQLMRQTRQVLGAHGLKPYEISNYAIPGQECRHNLVYWRGGNYLGLGPAAASHLAGRRWRNVPNLNRYLKAAERQEVEVEDWEELSVEQRASELVMLMLRLADGLDFEHFQSLLKREASAMFGVTLNRLEKMGMLRRTVSGVALTERGVYVADEVISELVREGG